MMSRNNLALQKLAECFDMDKRPVKYTTSERAYSPDDSVNITFKREVTLSELKEIISFAENQATTDRYVSTSIHCSGDYADVDIEFNEYGDMTVL